MVSFRCIVASRLLLDYQLHGTGILAPEVQKTVEDSTLIGFERIIDACLVHEVDGLLLSGDSFDPEARGLRGPAALVRGIERLAERDIAVVLQNSRADQWLNWPAGLRFPPNLRRLGPGFDADVAITRQGQLVARVAADRLEPSAAGAGWQISLPDRAGNAATFDLADDAGPAQGIRSHETGPHGCRLIEFDSDGMRPTFIPTAPVRWEAFELAVSPEMTRDDLLQEMAAALEQAPRTPCEKVWLIGWNASGAGPRFEALADRAQRDALLAELAGLDPVPGVRIHTHSLRLHRSPQEAPPLADSLAADCVARLHERFAHAETALHECLAGSALRGGPWEVRIESLMAELDAGEVAHDACRLVMHWLAAPEELSS